MLTYCLNCYKNIDSKFLKNKNVRTILLSNFAVCENNKSKFMKEQEEK